jgi:hypothetical protein
MADTTSSGMTGATEEAHRNLVDDTRFRRDQHGGCYYTESHTGERLWLSLADALSLKAELDEAAMHDADAEAGRRSAAAGS